MGPAETKEVDSDRNLGAQERKCRSDSIVIHEITNISKSGEIYSPIRLRSRETTFRNTYNATIKFHQASPG